MFGEIDFMKNNIKYGKLVKWFNDIKKNIYGKN